MKQKWMSWIALWAFMGFVTLPVQAAMVTTPDFLQSQQAQQERQQLADLLDREDVQQQLLDYGVAPETVKDRVSKMTDAEVAQLNQQIADMPAGSGVLGAAVLIFVVFVVTDVLGATDIFPFVHPIR
ncbi:DUF6627 family protein [Methylophaga sp. OBS3]|uniref:DUF6627 family protein n=1 Tax=Methylophaga sp. OBS3 TaxID=2991934 RepID=UPI0022592634|nr:DUF6627 family protein [Methylophaga sp. OBS3]MCX4188866.1 PA2779 family protein [Methylophaga sp. OBS3]